MNVLNRKPAVERGNAHQHESRYYKHPESDELKRIRKRSPGEWRCALRCNQLRPAKSARVNSGADQTDESRKSPREGLRCNTYSTEPAGHRPLIQTEDHCSQRKNQRRPKRKKRAHFRVNQKEHGTQRENGDRRIERHRMNAQPETLTQRNRLLTFFLKELQEIKKRLENPLGA